MELKSSRETSEETSEADIKNDRLLRLADARRRLGQYFDSESMVCDFTIRNWLASGYLDGCQIGDRGNWYIWESSLQKLIRKIRESNRRKTNRWR